MRALRYFLGSVVFFAAISQAPLSVALDHSGSDDDATPHASPTAMDMSGTGAAYLIIRNAGGEADRLIGGTTEVARAVEIHEVTEAEGIMTMQPLREGLEISAGGEVALEPGGYHLMLFGLTEDLTRGKSFALTLQFARAGEVTVTVTVRSRAEPAPDTVLVPSITAGEITIEDAWSRPAPAFAATALGTPEATPAH